MSIVLEGFDNSGKTRLANSIGWPVVTTGGPPKEGQTIQQFLDMQFRQATEKVVMDRISAISAQVYQGHMFEPYYMDYAFKMIRMGAIIIYCRPPIDRILDFNNHEVKEYDTEEHIADITRNARQYIDKYDMLMKFIPHLQYDYTNEEDHAVIQELVRLIDQ